ncbi:unnamed protein product [Urochloa decumbens]|uniref:SIAH-type domain-containing protein n=1 Tax=Urochloa decumbens TaxID=240449 RepID=A0ABC8W503_9POAL
MSLLPGESFQAGEERRRGLLEAAGKRAATTRASAGVRKKSRGSGSSDAAALPPSRVRPEGAAAAAGDAKVEDTDALDWRVLPPAEASHLPVRMLITFMLGMQCKVGHVVCLVCRDKLKATGKCHMCGIATGGYSRCHAMERLVESISFPCPNATYGCTTRPVYHDREGHLLKCPHRPGRCPDKDCGFMCSTDVLLDHFSGVHAWPPCTVLAAGQFKVRLNDGFNFLRSDHATSSPPCLLFLLKVARQQLGCAISVLCICPNAATNGEGPSPMEFELIYTRYVYPRKRSLGDQLTDQYQRCSFRVACMDLSTGLPSPDDCFQLVVPNFALGEDNKETIQIECRIFSQST